MKEECITKAILKWLLSYSWEIVCFDFPQSGTGRLLHPNNAEKEKNKGSINPDIVAIRGGICLFFENKDRFYYNDYEKQNELITENNYSIAIEKLLVPYKIKDVFYGIGLPTCKHLQQSKNASYLVDFIVGVEKNKNVSVLYNPKGITFEL